MTRKRIVAALAVGALAVTGAAQASSQDPSKGAPDAAPASGPTLGGKLPAASWHDGVGAKPKGYVVVHTVALASPAGHQAHGGQPCPAGTSVLGGGVFVAATGTAVSVNSSYPSANGWYADVNNASGAATSFNVYAVCGKAPRTYALVHGPLTTIGAGSQASGLTASCAGGKVLSGGAFSDTFDTLANINSSIPSGTGWRIDANNGSGSAEHVQSIAICGKLGGYHVVQSAPTFNAAGTQTGATAMCGIGYPIGGGSFSGSGDLGVSVNTSYPVAGGWTTSMNNASGTGEIFRSYVVCAGS
jgi:hypothetical protein